MSILKLSTWAKQNGYTYRGAYDRYARGDIPGSFRTTTGRVFVDTPEPTSQKPTRVAIYTRVSTSKQKADLDRQAVRMTNFAVNNGFQVDLIVKEIASGLNDKRPKLLKLLMDESVTHILIEHKDRLTRFGFNYIESLSDKYIIVANQALDDKDDLIQDLVSVITSMVARYYGTRKGRRKTEQIKSVLIHDKK